MANAGWEDVYVKGSDHIAHYTDDRTIRVRRLLALGHFDPVGPYNEPGRVRWNKYMQGEHYVPVRAHVWQALGFPAVELLLPFEFAVDLLNKTYNHKHTAREYPQDPSLTTYIFFGRTPQGTVRNVVSTQKGLHLAGVLDKLATALSQELSDWFQFPNGIGQFRTVDPEGLKLLIQPVEDGANGVSFALVQHAFNQVIAAINPNVSYIFEPEHNCHYTLVREGLVDCPR